MSDIPKKVAIMQIKTPLSIHLMRSWAYNQSADRDSQNH